MRITFLLLTINLLTIHAVSFTQSSKVSISLKEAAVKEILSSIEEQTDYKFLYSDDFIENRFVSIDVKNSSVAEVLDLVLKETGNSFREIENNLIVVAPFVDINNIQEITIKGKITDMNENPLPGVNVVEKGTTNGTITNIDGEYTISISSPDAILSFSFVGFLTEEIEVSGQTNINLTMVEDIQSLEEVVVVGYGTMKKKDLTGSISRISGDEMLQPSVTTFDKMLQGKVAGVQISQTTGAPGGNVNMLIRGISSISGGNQPLYVIDGFPINIGDGSSNTFNAGSNSFSSSSMANSTSDRINPLASINPADIESIEILKDASATAIYGSRGASGVVIITTKRGSSMKSEINVNVSLGVQEVAHKIDMMNAQEYIDFVVEGRDNAWVFSTGGSADDPDEDRGTSQRAPTNFRNPSSITTDTDWQDVIFRVAPVQNYQVSANGGNENIKYLVSGGYFDQKGIMLTSDYEKFNIRANIDAQILKKLKVSSTISGYYGLGSYPNTEGHYGLANPLMQALTASPTIPVYDEDGNPYFNTTDVTEGLGWLSNPLTVLNKNNYSDDRKKANLMSNNYIEYKIMDGLVLKSSIGLNYNSSIIKLWRSNAVPRYTSLNYPSTAGVTNTNGISWLNENTLSYKRLFKEKHSLDVLLGFTAQKESYERLSAGASDFPTNYVTYLYAGTVNTGTHLLSEWAMLSLIGRVNYSFAGKYLLTTTIRRDGCSRFGTNHKWGTFPSFSLGYNISEEPFMQSLSAISNLKIRTSYGFAGNNQIGNYSTIGLLNASNYVENDTESPGLVPSNLSNDDLTWEKSEQIDFGIDLGLFENRISLIADIYKNTKTDLLLSVELPAASGFTSSIQNVGDIQNKGIEIALQTTNIKSKNFNWTSDFVFSHNENEVLKLATEGALIQNSSWQVTMVGSPISSFYMMHQLGIFQTEEEVANSPIQHAKVQPGDMKFEDVNGDGTITTADQKIVGDPWPDYTWGFNNRFTYKNLSLYVAVNGSHGGQTYFVAGQSGGLMNCAGVQNQLAILDRWKSENDPGDGVTPRAIRSNYAYALSASSRYLFDNSYIRIKNINLSYTLPKRIAGKLYMKKLTVFADIANAFTFTDYPGYDPEASSTGNSITQTGLDHLTYPSARIYTLGLNFSF